MRRLQVYDGLHISDCFFPSYTFERASMGPVEQVGGDAKGRTKSPASKRKAAPRGHARAMLLGSRVDKQLQQVTACLRDYPHLSVATFLQPKTAAVADARQTVRYRIQTLRGTLNKHTREILRVLQIRGLRPLQSQEVVCHEALRIGTAVDLVCRNERTTQVCVLEIKTGYDGYYFHHTTHNMLPPFEKLNDSPHNQHQLQLAMTLLMFSRVYGLKYQSLEAYVVRSHAGGVTVYPLESWARNSLPAMQQAILRQRRLEMSMRHG